MTVRLLKRGGGVAALPPPRGNSSNLESFGLSELIRIASVFMQIYRVYPKLSHARRSWQNEVKKKKEYYFGPVLCRVWSTEFVNTRETSAILCWLKRGDQLGSRRDAKRLWAFHLFCLSHTDSNGKVIRLPLMILFLSPPPPSWFRLESFFYTLLSFKARLFYFPPAPSQTLPIWAPGDLNLPLTSWCVRSV